MWQIIDTSGTVVLELPGVSEVNIINRMLLFVDNLKKEEPCPKM